MSQIINQFIPAVHTYDAVGSTALLMDRFFKKLGFRSRIYALYRDPEVADRVQIYQKETRPQVDQDLNILHFALPSPLTEFFQACGGQRVIIYHNITPPHFFRGFQDDLVDFTALGLREIKSLSTDAVRTVAYSDFSARDLREMGFSNPEILPFLIDWDRYTRTENRVLARILAHDWVNILFVGRLVPNKKQDDLVRLLTVFRNSFHKKTRLILVGKGREGEKYLYEITKLIHQLGNPPVIFAGRVSPAELVTYYKHSHAFVCMSEHEGFCVPLIEAMHFQLPIIAYHSAAIPDTLQDAGIILKDKDFMEIAAWMHKVIFDEAVRTSVLSKQNQRLRDFRLAQALPKWEAYIMSLLE
ncbi:glycosyltransferase [candidate division CSSED10-310 bacterium]|uniref:Glycosyltransferase n=1 Tax=candidate division CSSED10-310 bacterium TaxID=2855610 RepID=A0ABV6YZY1_UNCC1